jgi:hypothetical protein
MMADHYMAPSSQDRHRPNIIISQPYSHHSTQGRPRKNPLENTKKIAMAVLIAAEKTPSMVAELGDLTPLITKPAIEHGPKIPATSQITKPPL